MNIRPSTLTDLFDLAQTEFGTTLAAFARQGIEVSPELSLNRTDRIFSYFDPQTDTVYISIPNPVDPLWKLKVKGSMALFSFDRDEEYLDFWQMDLPYVVAHELGHHLRFYYQQNAEHWEEEQIANRFASAIVKRRLSQDERQRLSYYLQRAFNGLAVKIQAEDDALSIYGNIHYALNARGDLDDDSLLTLELEARQQKRHAADILGDNLSTPETIQRLLAKRKGLIDRFNTQYTADAVRYAYYQRAWMYYELTSPEVFYLDTLAAEHLNLKRFDI